MRSIFLTSVLLAATASAIVTTAVPTDANACGGCFGPVDNPQVVTDHRMVMKIGETESVLWDQIQYTGRPEDFSWVLPVGGDVRVEIASGAFFDQLDAATAPQVQGPFLNGCNSGGLASFGPSADSAENGTRGGQVTVIRQEVIGPYETVVLRSENPSALTDWLRANHYTVPASIEPIIAYYVERRSDFVALRLSPGEGVQSMQPVRIRYATANTTLPLRMVAAGISDKVGIKLWVFGNGRYEAANFANGVIRQDDLVWDWNAGTPGTGRSNYLSVFDTTLRGLAGGRAWITEQSVRAEPLRWQFERLMGDSGDAAAAYEDFRLAAGDRPMGYDYQTGVWVTRLRTDLLARFLDSDLQLAASTDASEVSGQFLVNREIGTRPDPVCPSRNVVSAGSGATWVCAARPENASHTNPFTALLALGAIGTALAIAHRRRA